MSERTAMKIVLKQLFRWLPEKGRMFDFTEDQIEEAIGTMCNDDAFFDELLDFFADHITELGENYGLFEEDDEF